VAALGCGAMQCSWCGAAVAEDDGYRLSQPETRSRAVFCRLEHVVPWTMQGATWEPGTFLRDGEPDDALGRCTHCGDPLEEDRLLLVRHRGEHRIADAFCDPDHLLDWAKAGGRWQRAS
jgi:hypothetical protein